jgi:hypothetical protein
VPPVKSAMLSNGCALFLALSAGVSLGCAGAPPPCRTGPEGDVALGARTGASGVKTGAKTGLEGLKTAGRTAGGLFSGGTEGASEAWRSGKQATREEAKKGSAEVKGEAEVPRCAK